LIRHEPAQLNPSPDMSRDSSISGNILLRKSFKI
jgi:hypothetical protein